MKVLYWLGIGFDRHGPSVHLFEAMIEETLKAGHDVVVIAKNTGGPNDNIPNNLKHYDNLHFEIYYDHVQKRDALVRRYFEDIIYFFKTKKYVKKHKDADVVFIQNCNSPIFPINISHRLVKKPVLFNSQNIFPVDACVLGKLPNSGIRGIALSIFRYMQKVAYKKADKIVTISEDMKKTLIHEGADENKVEVVYNWSYDDNKIDIPNDDNLFLNDHPELKNKFRIVFAGNLGAMVNAEMFAEAAEKLKDYDDICFIIIGGGNNMNYLTCEAKSRKLDNMYFYPYQPKEYAKHNYSMANVNINALPSRIIYTCLPSKTATMINCERPMVVSVEKSSSYAKMLSKIDKCTVVDVDDVDGFVNAIMKIYENKYDKSTNSREVFLEVCSRNNAKKYVNIMEKMVCDIED